MQIFKSNFNYMYESTLWKIQNFSAGMPWSRYENKNIGISNVRWMLSKMINIYEISLYQKIFGQYD